MDSNSPQSRTRPVIRPAERRASRWLEANDMDGIWQSVSPKKEKNYRQYDLKIFKKNPGDDLFHIQRQERMLDDDNLPRLRVCQQGTSRKALMLMGSKEYALTHEKLL